MIHVKKRNSKIKVLLYSKNNNRLRSNKVKQLNEKLFTNRVCLDFTLSIFIVYCAYFQYDYKTS